MHGVNAFVVKLASISLLILSTLTGCGEDNQQNDLVTAPTEESIKVEALSGIASVKINTPTTVDLTPFILGDATQIEIGVSNTDYQNCPEPIVSNLSFKITPKTIASCYYDYQIKRKGSDTSLSTGEMQIIVTSDENAYLAPISLTTVLAESIEIDIFAKLSEQLTGYTLESFTLEAAENLEKGVAVLDSSNTNMISYQSPSSVGWNYISYILDNGTEGEEKYGYVYISIADKINRPPQIATSIFTYPDIVPPNTEITFGLINSDKGFPSIIDPDGDQWFLDSVTAVDATVAVAENNAFTFSSASNGEHYVTYIIRDERNAYSLGSIKFTVSNFSQRDWENIIFYITEDCMDVNRIYRISRDDEDKKSDNDLCNPYDQTFNAPLTKSEVESSYWSGNALEEIKGDKSYEVALWNVADAKNFCKSEGLQIPTVQEFIHFLNRNELEDRASWPNDLEYLVYDDVNLTYTSMLLEKNNTQTKLINNNSLRYLSCVAKRQGNLKIDINGFTKEHPAGKPLEIPITLTLNGFPQPDREIIGEYSGYDESDGDIKVADPDDTAILDCNNETPDNPINLKHNPKGYTDENGKLICVYRSKIATHNVHKYKLSFISEKLGNYGDAQNKTFIDVHQEYNSTCFETDIRETLTLKTGTWNYFKVRKRDQYQNLVGGHLTQMKADEGYDIKWIMYDKGDIGEDSPDYADGDISRDRPNETEHIFQIKADKAGKGKLTISQSIKEPKVCTPEQNPETDNCADRAKPISIDVVVDDNASARKVNNDWYGFDCIIPEDGR